MKQNTSHVTMYELPTVLVQVLGRPFAVFGIILVIALILRLDVIADLSFSQDETTMLQFANGLLEKGYPYLQRGDKEHLMATYELIPFFIAPSIWAFGLNEYAARLPALFFGLGTLALIFYAGRAWFGVRVALLASAYYAVSPWAIYWATSSFYPSQLQFFSFLTVLFVYRVSLSEVISAKDCYLTAFFFCCTYLTWEASGLLLPIFGVLFVWNRWGKWNWLSNPHIWIAMSAIIIVILAQLLRRTLLQMPFLAVGSSRASIKFPQIAFTAEGYDFYYYIGAIFGDKHVLILTVFFLLGILFWNKSKSMVFAGSFVFLSVFTLTNLLSVHAYRYLYFVLPVFLLATAAATVYSVEWLVQRMASVQLASLRITSNLSVVIIIGLQLVLASGYVFRIAVFEESQDQSAPWELKGESVGIDFRGVVSRLKEEYRPGDIIVTRAPFPLDIYMGQNGDYFVQTITSSLVNYSPKGDVPYYRDKWAGNYLLRTKQELEDVLYRHHRVWFLATPYGATKSALTDDIMQMIDERMTLKAESNFVRLYLWES